MAGDDFLLQRFFKDYVDEKNIFLDGEDKDHVLKSLRMKVGEKLVVCDGKLNDYFCEIKSFSKSNVFLNLIKKEKNNSEPSVKVHLYQAIPKLNKLEFIIQKSVELGVFAITPVLTKRCVAIIDKEKLQKKTLRLQKISKQAAAQSGRGIIPLIGSVLKYEDAIEEMAKKELKIMFYEYGKEKLNNINIKGVKNISMLVGCEGGFEKHEVLNAEKKGIINISLGKRILRCETAPICALSVLMNMTENL